MTTGTTTTPAADQQSLPPGFEVRLRADVLRVDHGRILVGGSPARVVRLSARARELLINDRLVVDSPATSGLARRLLQGNLADPVLDTVHVSPAEMTVVIPVRDRTEQLDRCLSALAPLQVVVVDDASRDPAAVAAVARRHGARVVPLVINVGPAGARNAGLVAVDTPLVAFVDSDVVVSGADLLALARHCTDPDVAVVGPLVKGEARSARPRWFERYDAASSSLDLGHVGYQVLPRAAVAWLPSACLVGRVASLGAGFDERMRVAEDVDLIWRLTDSGLVVRYDPTVQARHDSRTTMHAWLGRKFVYGTGGADLAARHGNKVAPAALSPIMAIGAAALLLRRWWSVPVAAAAVAATARSLTRSLPLEQGATQVATRLAVRGLGWAVRQEAGLLLRHWWPLGLLGALFSRPLRRGVLTAVLVDLAVFLRQRTGVNPFTALFARRLDDIAYGSGLWWGAARHRSPSTLLVKRARPPKR